MPESETEGKTWQVTVRLPRELEPSIRTLARKRLVPPAIVLRQLIGERLQQLEDEDSRTASH